MAIHEHRPAWVADPMPWGDSEEGWFPGEQGSPPGPAFQEDGRWDQPAAYEVRRPGLRGTAARRGLAGAGDRRARIAAIGFTALVVWRRRRRRATP